MALFGSGRESKAASMRTECPEQYAMVLQLKILLPKFDIEVFEPSRPALQCVFNPVSF